MTDLVVTVPKQLWLPWIAEGDAAGDPCTGEEWGFYLGGIRPPISTGDRLYIVAHDKLRGYAPVVRLTRSSPLTDELRFAGEKDKWVICRRGNAVAVTIDETIKGFRGWRRRWWTCDIERPFPDWRTP